MSIKKIKKIDPPYPFEAYTHVVSPLSKEEGGGFLITFPDLPGCMSDGETIEKAIENGRDAFIGWVSAQADMGRVIPKPAYSGINMESFSGRFVQRVPKSLHAKLAERAKQEGVSLNTFVLSLISEGLGHKRSKVQAVGKLM